MMAFVVQVKKGMRVATPMGPGVVSRLDAMRDIATVELNERVSDTIVAFDLPENSLHVPELRHFQNDDPVKQYNDWASTDVVIELLTIKVQGTCSCGCGHCWMTPTASWVLGREACWQGATHDTTNGCQCLTAAMCNCLNEPLPEITRDWFSKTMAGIQLP